MKSIGRWLILGWVAVAAGTGRANENGLALATLEEVTAEPWQVYADAIHYTILFEHDALQNRADFESDKSERWRDGDSSGQGWGLRLTVAKGDGAASMRYLSANSDYTHDVSGGHQSIETDRSDLELLWNQRAGATEFALWGWDLGFRYIGLKKRMDLVEGHDELSFNDGINWYLIQAGYFGRWRPFKGPNLGVYASINGFLGEASGIARKGHDDEWDGDIDEQYDQEYSLGYGARFDVGVNWDLRMGVRVSMSYHREWLYSFDATESGIVVFPDNSDALFIETTHGVLLSIGYAF